MRYIKRKYKIIKYKWKVENKRSEKIEIRIGQGQRRKKKDSISSFVVRKQKKAKAET